MTAFLFSASSARASLERFYPSALPNQDLQSELTGDDDRLIPQYENFSFAADGITFLRHLRTEDFYHGLGYWIQFRTEARPHPDFTINARSILYSGSSSEGYATPSGLYTLIGFTGTWPSDVAGFRTKVRVVDLGRQTIAEGLLIQEREMNGALLDIAQPGFGFRLLIDSTGALLSDDDVFAAEVALFDRSLRLGSAWWFTGISENPPPDSRKPYHYFTLSTDTNRDLTLGFEAGRRGSANAWMIRMGYSREWQEAGLSFAIDGEHREYQDGFGEGFTGKIEHQYVSFDQYDKAYTSPMNVFVFGEGAKVNAVKTRLAFAFDPKWKIRMISELGKFDFSSSSSANVTPLVDHPYHFYRADIVHCPIEGRDDCLLLHVSNKVLNGSYTRPPQGLSLINEPFFKSVSYVGIEGRFRF